MSLQLLLPGHYISLCFTLTTVTSLSFYLLYYQAKYTGYFLVVVPLIAFCIRCMIGAFHAKVAQSEEIQHEPKRTRWKYALSDITEADIPDAESTSDFKASLYLHGLIYMQPEQAETA